jgi:hypothetical protein
MSITTQQAVDLVAEWSKELLRQAREESSGEERERIAEYFRRDFTPAFIEILVQAELTPEQINRLRPLGEHLLESLLYGLAHHAHYAPETSEHPIAAGDVPTDFCTGIGCEHPDCHAKGGGR